MRHNRKTKGTALVEAVFAIPMLALILGLTWWVGWAMTNQQHVKAADRYTAWRSTYGGGVTTDSLNTDFYQRKANVQDISYGNGQAETVRDYCDLASRFSQAAGGLADGGPRQRFPRGTQVTVSADFPTSVGLWNRYQGAIHSEHFREGVEWRYGQAAINTTVLDQYMTSMDACLSGVQQPGDGMAQMVRTLYSNGW